MELCTSLHLDTANFDTAQVVPVDQEYDLLIVGAGPAGYVASVGVILVVS